MSIKVWARNKDTGEILHINSVDKSFKGKMVCLDDNCGEVLNICMGEKKKPYFSHSRNSTCSGGGVETLLHLLSKQILKACKTFVLPEEYFIFRGKKIVFNEAKKVFVSSVTSGEVLEQGFKTGFKLMTLGGKTYYIEPSLRGISATRRTAYAKHDLNVIEIDLRKFSDADNIDEEALREYICGGSGIKTFVCSKAINRLTKLVNDSEYTSNGELIACPARDYKAIVESKKCKTCPFYMYRKDKSIVCSGKGCYSSAVDFKINELELRREKYSNILPEPILVANKGVFEKPFGLCKCGNYYDLVLTRSNTRISGLFVTDNEALRDKGYVYRHCKVCGSYSVMKCPRCGKYLTLKRNSHNGKIFLCCSDYDCKFTLTTFTQEPCGDNYADEITTIKSWDNLIKNYSKAFELIREVRNKHKAIK